MIEIHIPSTKIFDESTMSFKPIKEKTLVLEHSLVSISKWEAKYQKVFLSKERKSVGETQYYIKCMTITQNVDDIYYSVIPKTEMIRIQRYIENPMSATFINGNNAQNKAQNSREPITSELIYFWMVSYNIPFKCEKWHLNRLLTLIEVCNFKNQDPSKNKMSKKELLSRNRALNEARKAKFNTKG